MKLSAFDYKLPKELISQYPSKERDGSKLNIKVLEKSLI